MVKVINESEQLHRIGRFKKIITKEGKEIKEPIFSADYEFPPAENGKPSVVDVPKEDFENMVNEHDHTLGRIYTKKQWKTRLEAIENQKRKVIEFNQASQDEQEKLAKKLIPDMRTRYYLENALPHEA